MKKIFQNTVIRAYFHKIFNACIYGLKTSKILGKLNRKHDVTSILLEYLNNIILNVYDKAFHLKA